MVFQKKVLIFKICLIILQHLTVVRGQFDANFTLQNIWVRLPEQAMRTMIQCISTNETPSKIKFSRRYDTGQGTRLARFSQQFLQGKPVNARILLMPSEDELNRFGAYQCKVIREGVTTEIVTLKLSPLSLAELDALTPFQVAFKGDNVELAVNVLQKREEAVVWRHNGEELNGCEGQLKITLLNVKQSDAGIYECYYKGRRKKSVHALMRLIVRGCPNDFFGKNCDEKCPPCYNGGVCHEVYGVCVCPAGFTGMHCQQACGGNRFGADCSKLCTPPQNISNMDNGCAIHQFCKPDPYGCSCAPGFKGPHCMEHCESGWYGADCKQPCHCAYGKNACDRITGACTGGCVDGFKGESCEIEDSLATAGSVLETTTMTYCSIGIYGASCDKHCNCAGNQPCHISTGQCSSGCKEGWDGPSCSICSPGRFGESCDFFCHCEGGSLNCDREDGYCYSGCEAGWAGFTCQQECTAGRFGQNCALTCHCFSGPGACDKITGNCTGDCEAGFMGKDCQTLCSQYSYGINCDSVCSCYNGGHCNRIDGSCSCEARWRGQACNESAPQILAATDVEANAGQVAFISCTADAIPKPEMNIASSDFPGIAFNVRTLEKKQYQVVIKMKPQNEGAFDFSCSARNLHGFDEKIVTLTVTTPPKLLSVPELVETSNISITVKWKPWTYLVDFGGKLGDIVEYLVLYRESSTPDWKTFKTWTQDHMVTIENLKPYGEYRISIKCKRNGSGGEGGDSPYLTVRTKCGDSLPEGIPQDFLPELIGSDFVKLTWIPPSETFLRCKLIGYVLKFKPEKNSTVEITKEIKNLTKEITLYDLSPDTVYQLNLYPHSSYGLSKYSAGLMFHTYESVPGPVVGLQFKEISFPDSLLISWEEPLMKNGVIKSYNVKHVLVDRGQCNSTNSSRGIIKKQSVLSTITQVHLKSLFPYSTYEVVVSAETAAGEGLPTTIMVATAEAGPNIGPPNLHVVSSTSVSIKFSWEPVPCELLNGMFLEYEYTFLRSEILESSDLISLKKSKRLADIDIGSTTRTEKTKDLSAVIDNLQPYVEYGFALRAHTKVEPGPFTEFIFHRTNEAVPSNPQNFMIVSSSSRHITISWFSPIPANGIIQKYEMQHWSVNDQAIPSAPLYFPASGNEKRIFGNVSDLTPASDYLLKIRASTNAGWGNWSEQIIGRTQDDIPAAPTEVKINNVEETIIELSWSLPKITNGFIIGYKITYSALSSLDTFYVNSADSSIELYESSTSTSIQGLRASTQYSILIQAQTSAGYGPPVSFICWTTILGDHVLPSVEALNFQATNESIPVVFSTDGKSAVRKYQVIVEDSRNTEPINESLLSDYKTGVVQNGLPYYIAAEIDSGNVSDSGQQAFLVGDKKIWGGFENVHLNAGHEYRIRIRTFVEKEEGVKSVLSEPKEQLAVTSMFPLNKKRERKVFGVNLLTFILLVIACLVLIFLIIFFAVLIICRKNEKKKKSGKIFSNRDSGISDSLTWSVMYKVPENETSDGPLVCEGWKYTSAVDKSSLKKNKMYAKSCQGIKVENLSDCLTNPTTSLRIAEEFKQLVSGQTAAWTVARKSENLKKNRYGNILPYDRYRVILQTGQNVNDSDYINASYVDGYGQPHEYIVTQGPTDGTMGDFWRMVWQENSPVIIMLTDLVENGKKKCSQYWPDAMEKQTMEIENIQILLIHSETCPDFIIRTILMRKMDVGQTHRIMQYQFCGWPDRTVPINPYYLLKMIKKVRADHSILNGPMIVHCSAGSGRSGTYVALDSLIRQAAEEERVDIFRFVNNARMQRINLVQTLDQYLFIHEALLEVVSTEDTSVPLALISLHLKEMNDDGTLDPKSFIRKQFELLKASQKTVDVSHCNVALSECNIFKNRDPMTVPADTMRVKLLTDSATPELDDYINAIFVDGYLQKNLYLVTQTPMQHTVEDFLQLIYQNQSSLILMLDNFNNEDYANFGQYWPNCGQNSFGNFEMQVVQYEEHEDLVIRIMKLINYKQPSNEPHKIIQLQYKVWPYDVNIPISANSILTLINVVEAWYQRSDGGPITVHCMDGASRSGLFCAAVYICQQLITENCLDVFQAVKNIRISRPEFVPTLDQFAFCFEVANELVISWAQNNSTRTRSLKGLSHKI